MRLTWDCIIQRRLSVDSKAPGVDSGIKEEMRSDDDLIHGRIDDKMYIDQMKTRR